MGGTGVTNLNAIKGQVVGVTSAGGMTEFLTVEALARRGLKRNHDYRIHYAGNSPARVLALETKIIQAAAFSPGERVALEPKGYTLLMDMVQVIPEFPLSILASSRRKLDSSPVEVEAFLRGLHRAMEVIRTDKDRAAAAAFKKTARGDSRQGAQSVGLSGQRLFHRHQQRKYPSADLRRRCRGRSAQNWRRRKVFCGGAQAKAVGRR